MQKEIARSGAHLHLPLSRSAPQVDKAQQRFAESDSFFGAHCTEISPRP